MKLLEFLPPGLRRLFLYALCGGSGVVLDFAAYSLLVMGGAWYQLANIVGYALGTVLSFFLNRAITFGVMDAPVRRFMSFAGVAFIGYLISSVILWALVEQAHVNPLIAKIITLGVVLITQFTLNSVVTFRRSAKAGPTQGT